MRIALLQVQVRSGSRSANLTNVLRRLVEAAEAVPAPDLLVLPASCDGFAQRGVTQAMAQGFGESLAAAAREWGLYVAGGLLQAAEDGVREQARLYDPDGDVIAWSAADGAAPGSVFATPLGRVAVGRDHDGAEFIGPDAPCDLVLLHGGWSAPAAQAEQACRRLQTRLADMARGGGAALCAVGAVGDPRGRSGAALFGGSALYRADGRCVVACRHGTQQTVVGEVVAPAATEVGRAKG